MEGAPPLMMFRRRSPQERIARSVARMLERDCGGPAPQLEVNSWMMDTERGISITIRGRVRRMTHTEIPAEPLHLTPEMVEDLQQRDADPPTAT
jgi:hypothetical protein